MKKFLMLIAAVLGLQVFAATAAADREPFTGTDGTTYYLRAATIQDIDNLALGLSEPTKIDRRLRVTNGHFGVFIVENEDATYVDRLFTGRMPLGFQPANCTAGSEDEMRKNIIQSLYVWLLNIYSIEPKISLATRSTVPDMLVELINNDVHAATAIISENAPFNTVAVQDALARFSHRLNFKVAPDSTITPEGNPLLIISISENAPVLPAGSQSKIFSMPYYAGTKGMRRTVVTSIDGSIIPELPVEITNMLDAYKTSLKAPLLAQLASLEAAFA
jgi:hypothetical protein